MPFQKGGRLVHPVTRLLLYRIYHILILFANTTSRFSAPIFHSSLNTDLQYRDISSEVTIVNPNIIKHVYAYIENGMVSVHSYIPPNIEPFGGIVLFRLPLKYAPRTITYGIASYPADAADINKIVTVSIDTDGNAGVWQINKLFYSEPFMIQYPLKRN